MAVIERVALHTRISHILRKEIRSKFSPGDRLPSELEFTKRFGVSIVTVREAMLQLCHDGLVERRQGSGTYVSEKSRKQTVALIVSNAIICGQGTYFFSYVSQRIQEVLSEKGIDTRVFVGDFEKTGPDSGVTMQTLRAEVEAHRVHAAIPISKYLPDEWLDLLAAQEIPVMPPDQVQADYVSMLSEGLKELLARGRKRIAFMCWGGWNDQHAAKGLFLPSYIRILAEQGMRFRKDWVFGNISPVQINSQWDLFCKTWRAKGERPDAIFITDDYLYRYAAPAIMALGIRIPDDLLVVTHANKGSDVAYPFPTLRTEFDPEQFVLKIVAYLERALAGEPSEKSLVQFQWQGLETISARQSVS